MWRFTGLLILLMVPSVLAAQPQETLLDSPIESGGFGGPVVKFTEIDDEFGVLVGGRGGWIIDHSFVIAAGGYGLANVEEFRYSDPYGDVLELQIGYGGLELEYVNQAWRVVHFSVQALIGGGGVRWERRHSSDSQGEDDTFFIAEPGLSIMINITEFFRIGLGGSYRFTEGVELAGLEHEDFTGTSGVITFKFGSF